MARCCLIFLVLCLVKTSIQRSTPEADSYVAAVLESQVELNNTLNLQQYLAHVRNAAAQDADILVFSEDTLGYNQFTEIPVHGNLKQYPIPYKSPSMYNVLLVSLSQAAATNEIYLVVNLPEKVNCRTNPNNEYCPQAKTYFFNSYVVFDRNGAIILRYRKINLYMEKDRDHALKPDLGVFTTDFGVTFGVFICFDILFQVPAVQIITKNNITDVITSTMWPQELPYFSPIAFQQGFAYSMNVNLLAAGADDIRNTVAGSGIYSGKAGALISIMPSQPTTRLLVSRVPKVPGQLNGDYTGPIRSLASEADNLAAAQDYTLQLQTTRLLVPGLQEFTLSYKEVTCNFRINMQPGEADEHYTYRATAFDGVRIMSDRTAGNRICSVVFCKDSNIDSCGIRFTQYIENSVAIFKELSVSATLPAAVIEKATGAMSSLPFGITLDVSLQPLATKSYIYHEKTSKRRTTVNMTLVDKSAALYTFGVYERVYSKDGQSPTQSGFSHKFNGLLMLLAIGVALIR